MHTLRSAPLRRRLLATLAVAVTAAGLAACDLAPIPGDGPLRYRDPIFTDVTKTSGITYGTAVDQQGNTVTLALDLYEPAGDTVEARPLIVWVHGGSFKSGSRTSPEIVDQANVFAREGYINASISYRLAPNGCTTVSAECIQAINDARTDAQNAIRFLRAHADEYGIDPERVAIAGTSAGAITALGVGYMTDDDAARVDAAVSLSGAVIFNGSVDPGDAPALLFHGTNDPLVPYAWAQSTVTSAWDAGLLIYLITWDGEGHVPYAQHRGEIQTLTRNFLYRRLDAANAEQ